eukprot:scaffold1290_cov367-Prasinococcus_capsulatus_cf.AAC.12
MSLSKHDGKCPDSKLRARSEVRQGSSRGSWHSLALGQPGGRRWAHPRGRPLRGAAEEQLWPTADAAVGGREAGRGVTALDTRTRVAIPPLPLTCATARCC